MSPAVGCRRSLDSTLLWLWRRPAATVPIGPLAWEHPYDTGAALEKAQRQKRKKKMKWWLPVAGRRGRMWTSFEIQNSPLQKTKLCVEV